MQGSKKQPALAIVQHGHQYLITDGYDNREGLSEVLEGFATVFALHLKYEVPLNLHLSGTLIEAIAWHAPSFFGWIHALRRAGLLELLGSTYAQNIMPLFSDEHNLRQIDEALSLYRRHLGVEPEAIKGFWVPERVWHTEKLARVLRSDSLLNGGYAYVLLDDRLAYPLDGPYAFSARQRFDARTPPTGRAHEAPPGGDLPSLLPYRLENGEGLCVVPISAVLRYAVPPRHARQWEDAREVLRRVAAAPAGAIAVYGDDLEKAAAVGPWTNGRWTRAKVDPYEKWLAWIGAGAEVRPVLLASFLREHPASPPRRVDPGTYFELAHGMRAGEDYAGFWLGSSWRPHRELLLEAEALLRRARAPRSGLWELAWKQLMASSCETAWHDVGQDGECRPAPWARAICAHAKSVFVIAAAAEWQRQRDGRAHVERLDVDHDGADEVILKNDHLYAVLAPDHGGRLVYLFDLTAEGGRLVVGNPADDWNWQEEQNRYMEIPSNHPGAFADAGHEKDPYRVLAAFTREGGVEVQLVHHEPESPLAGALKVFRLAADARRIDVSYVLPRAPERFGVGVALSPDYLSLLHEGGRALRPMKRNATRGWRNRTASVWVHIPPGEPVMWDRPERPACGHGMLLRATAYGRSFGLSLGVGAMPSRRDAARARREPRRIEAIGEALMAYDLGLWESVRPLPGAKNDHYEITTNRGRYVLRRSRPTKTLEALRFEHELMSFLRSRGLPVPAIVPPAAGGTWVVVEDHLYRVTAFVHGAPYRSGELRKLQAVARALGAYHQHAAAFRPSAPCPGEPSLEEGLRERIARGPARRADAPARLSALHSRALAQAEATLVSLAPLYSTLPRQLIHGGCRRDSFVFSGDDPCGLLDFDSARFEARALDLAVAIHDFARMECAAALDLAVVAAFVEAYQAVEPLSPVELHALPLLLKARRLKRLLGRCARLSGCDAPTQKDMAEAEQEAARIQWLESHEAEVYAALASLKADRRGASRAARASRWRR
ncbi:phosphotransferase [Polyangium spumosum]|nr:phosphotransferase [Polyangium spumosum]